MTDKVIIDGVDVSMQEYDRGYCEDTQCVAYRDINKCRDKKCWYKNYAQLFKKHKEIKNHLQRKEQQCEELKKQYNCYSCGTCKSKEDYINIKRHCENAINSLHKEQAKSDRYKQALEKIEEILTYYANSSVEVKNIDGTFSLKKEQGAIILNFNPRKAQEGLNIINEVKDE